VLKSGNSKFNIMPIDSFEEFLKKKKDENPKLDWNQREKQWIDSVTEFYANVKKWLKPFIDEQLITIKEDSWVNIYEHGFGDYDIKKLDIIIGKNDLITLTPRATLVVGGYGRIDMRGPRGEISIFQKKWGKWKFIDKLTRNELWETNEKTFKSAIQDLVNG
jgi:hypothetical protein